MNEYKDSMNQNKKNLAEYLVGFSSPKPGPFWVQSVINIEMHCTEIRKETIFCKGVNTW